MPSPDQTQPSIQDGGGERRLSSDDNVLAKRLKPTTTEGIGLKSVSSAEEHNMNVENNEPKASVQSQGEETAQESPVLAQHTTSPSSVTKSGPLDM